MVLSFAHHRAGWRPGGGFSRNYLVSNRLYLKSVLKRPFSPPSNGDFPGRMAFRRRRIRVLPTKRRFDGVESAFCRQNGDPTRSDWGCFWENDVSTGGETTFSRQSADSTAGNGRLEGKTGFPHGGKRLLPVWVAIPHEGKRGLAGWNGFPRRSKGAQRRGSSFRPGGTGV